LVFKLEVAAHVPEPMDISYCMLISSNLMIYLRKWIKAV